MDEYTQTLSSIPGKSVLDVATGRGGFLLELAKHLPNFESGTGIDHNAAAMQAAAEKNEDDRLRFLAMDGGQLDFPDASFDVVSICNSLHHMPDLAQCLNEMKRVLKPGGSFVIQEMVSDGLTAAQAIHRDLHHWWAAVDSQSGIAHNETYTRQEIHAHLAPLALENLTAIELIDLESDPKDPALMQHLEPVFTRYFEQIAKLPDGESLQKQGEVLKQRFSETGIHWATALLITGKKAV